MGTQDNVITARVTIEFSRNLCSIARSEGLCKSCSKEFITQIEEKLYGKDPPLKPRFQSYICPIDIARDRARSRESNGPPILFKFHYEYIFHEYRVLIIFITILRSILTSDVELYFQKNAQQDRKRSHVDN